jgi:hypothetical protein
MRVLTTSRKWFGRCWETSKTFFAQFYLELMRSKVCGSQGNFCIKQVMAGKFGVYRMRSYLKQEVFNGENKWRKKNHVLR